ncbi:amino acid/amide ABC transporter substrate-binding protein (HAAT family) [Stella humosa]|uniref:Amino acid/amide ABC transporter substrate-binding protein (HAAT family) n=1 Tax=Stella humosa TaxID=94 RepID=A0A3N1KPZ0_9PROT|nr:ABC transporter substrate-binding protein [Stella humosa]ROP81357.1 amino acid/amide ABC transporter substrate-binding protein (HAAT family) [Stella humosa]BBK32707.1 ABC transporter permease [Stella humosa]
MTNDVPKRRGRALALGLLALGSLVPVFDAVPAAAADPEIHHPMLVTRTGPFATGATGVSSGQQDYFALLNAKGGIEGAKIRWSECEFAYATPRALECYERFRGEWKIVYPNSTPAVVALGERLAADKVAGINPAGNRADSTDGETFPYLYPVVANFWAQASSTIRYLAQREGGEDKLKGKKIAFIHLDNAYGRGAIPVLEVLSKRFGFEWKSFPLPPPGLEQSAAWVDIARRYRADWAVQWNYGQSCTVPFTEIQKVGFPIDKFIGTLWCGSEEDIVAAGDLAKNYVSANYHGVGRDFPVIKEILAKVHDAGKGNIERERVGTVAYNRGVLTGILIAEAFGHAIRDQGLPLTGEKVLNGLNKVKLTKERLKELGAEGLVPEISLTPQYHGGVDGQVFQRWDGKTWTTISGWIPPYEDVVWDEVKRSAAAYRAEVKAKQ